MPPTIVLEYINRKADAEDWPFDPTRNQDWGLPERCTVDTAYFHIELELKMIDHSIEYYTITCCIDTELMDCVIGFEVDKHAVRTFAPAFTLAGLTWPVWLASDLAGMQFRLEAA